MRILLSLPVRALARTVTTSGSAYAKHGAGPSLRTSGGGLTLALK